MVSGNLARSWSTAWLEAPPRPPTRVRLLTPELRAAIQEKELAQARAAKRGNGSEEAVIEEAKKIEESKKPGLGRNGPRGSHGPGGYRANGAGLATGPGGYGGYRYAPSPAGGYGRYGGHNAAHGRHGYGSHAGGHRRGGGSMAGVASGSTAAGRLYVDVVPWNGRVEEGPCDPAGVFEVRSHVRELAPHLLGSGCEKYVMDADKMLNNLPTDFASDGVPACRNDYLVKSTAKTVYNVEQCATQAMARAEHVNKAEELEIDEMVRELRSRRMHVLLPVNGYSSPASFPGHPHMSPSDWANFDRDDSAGQMARQWGNGSTGSGGHVGYGTGGHGMHGHGHNPDVYGTAPQPQEPLQHGGMGMPRPRKELPPKEQAIRDAVERAKKLAKDPSLIPGPKEEDGALPSPPRAVAPIFAEPRPMLDFSSPSVDLPVYGKPVEMAQMPSFFQAMVWSICTGSVKHIRRGHRLADFF